MSDSSRDAERLPADLAHLRAALRALEVPQPDEAALRERFRAERARLAQPPAVRPQIVRRRALAAAAVVVLAVGVLAATAVWRTEAPQPVASAVEAPRLPASPVGAFQPLPSSPGLVPSSEYSVVRVRIPLAAFAVVPGTVQDGTIEADLLVGEDGLARAIRFNETVALRASVAQE